MANAGLGRIPRTPVEVVFMLETLAGGKQSARARRVGRVVFGACLALCLPMPSGAQAQDGTYRLDTKAHKWIYQAGAWRTYALSRNAGSLLCGGKTIFTVGKQGRITAFDLSVDHDTLLVGALIAKGGRTYVSVYDAARQRHLAVKDMTAYRPWKLRLYDADGDGVIELCLGVYKKSPLHPVLARRLFLYNFDGGALRPKWLGSRLAHPFTDFDFAMGAKGPALYAVELDSRGRRSLNAYKWEGFGFTKTRIFPGALPWDAAFARGCRAGGSRMRLLLMQGERVLKELG